MSYKRTLVTCALPYANGPVHIGHLAGAYIPGDIYVRYLRMRGEDVVFICGSDEHGVPITIKAREQGVTPQDIVDKYHSVMKDAFTGLGINFDIYSRTTSKVHDENASEFFRKLYDDDKFITKESEQLYDEQARMFLTDRLIEGTCPKCGNPHAYGDQCEKCGSTLSPEELLDPKSKLSGSTPVKKKTKHWYLPLDKYEPWLRDWILEQHKEWKTNVYGQCKSWLDGGLQPRAVTRDLDWGVPVPVDGAEGKVLYVWFDAPIGYISNTKELLPQSWEKWWKDPETRLVHFIGKDNIVFHCIVFPSMLKAYGDYILPDNVPANEFLNLEGDKISTSRNWAVWLNEYVDEFPGQEDVLRYVLCANAPETKDNDFTWKDFQQRNNSELVAIFGNFVNRAVVLTHKYFGGKVPANLKPEAIDAETLARRSPAGRPWRKTSRPSTSARRSRTRWASPASATSTSPTRSPGRWPRPTWTARPPSSTSPCRSVRTSPSPSSRSPRSAPRNSAASFASASMPVPTTAPAKAPRRRTSTRAAKARPCIRGRRKSVEGFRPVVLCWTMLGSADLLPAGHQLGEAVLLFQKIEDSVVEAQIARLKAIKAEREAAEAAQAAAKPPRRWSPRSPKSLSKTLEPWTSAPPQSWRLSESPRQTNSSNSPSTPASTSGPSCPASLNTIRRRTWSASRSASWPTSSRVPSAASSPTA